VENENQKDIPSSRIKAAWRKDGRGPLKVWAAEHAPELYAAWRKNKAALKKPRRIAGWPDGRVVAPRGGNRRWGR
jgi:hypothetical protein